MKIYTLKANKGKNSFDLQLTIDDLVPVPHKRNYCFNELVGFMKYSKYQPDWDNPMEKEYDKLYQLHGNPKIDFFKVKDTDIIVMPGTYLYTTVLTEQDIKDMDNRKHI